ncbi:MAG: MMPL family transporter [Verrucomicrobiales bacterium]|nr:MMPL family transporter [Verrucomicrobiales bacterium]
MKSLRFWLWAAILVALILGFTRLRFDVDILNVLPDDLTSARGLKELQKRFTKANELIVTVEAGSADEAESAARGVALALRSLTNEVASVTWQSPWRENADDATELLAFLWLNHEPSAVNELERRLRPEVLPQVLMEARERLATSLSPMEMGTAGYDPYGLTVIPGVGEGMAPELLNADAQFSGDQGRFRLVFVEGRGDLGPYQACQRWIASVRDALARARLSGEVPASARIRLTGRPAFVTEIAAGMEGDTAGSVGGTLAIIGLLFWLTHRRLRPLLWLVAVLGLTLVGTMALGGWVLGTVHVVSLGFAAILLGLAEDFGIVIYQESRSHPGIAAGDLRRLVVPGVVWSAITTAGAFLTLRLSHLPGLAQLGTLVALGIGVAAVAMLYVYLPVVLRLQRDRDRAARMVSGANTESFLLFTPRWVPSDRAAWVLTGLLALCASLSVGFLGLRFDRSPDVLRQRNGEAEGALRDLQRALGKTRDPLWVLIPGRTEAEVGARLEVVGAFLERYQTSGQLHSITLPSALWPNPAHQVSNRLALGILAARAGQLRSNALASGFSPASLTATESILRHWQTALATEGAFWPSNRASRWVLDRLVSRNGDGWMALAALEVAGGVVVDRRLAEEWPPEFEPEGITLAGWDLLGAAAFESVTREFPKVVLPIVVLIVISLGLAFRRVGEVLLSVGTLVFGGLLLAGAMNLLGWRWDILNLMALPLLFGMGVDFSIHMQLALQRHDGDVWAVRRSVGRALSLAGSTTVAGFVSLAFSSNAGLASLGRVCALGIAAMLAVALFLLPAWWAALRTGHSR